MPTSRDDIRRWIADARARGATHMIVACDTFSYDDYPVAVLPGQSVRARFNEYNGPNMQKVMEVYALHLDIEAQLLEHRAFHFEDPPTPEPLYTVDPASPQPEPAQRHREPLIVQPPTVLSRVLEQIDADAHETIEHEPEARRRRRIPEKTVTLAKRVLALIKEEPWLSATLIANRLKASPGTVSSLLLKLAAPDGPLIREHGRGPRGGFAYALNPDYQPPPDAPYDGPRTSRYDLLNLEDWL